MLELMRIIVYISYTFEYIWIEVMFNGALKIFLVGIVLFFVVVPGSGYDILDRALNPQLWADPAPGHAFQFSSYDRYGGNYDGGTYLREDPDGSKVMAEISGPGVVSRIWVTRRPFPNDARFQIFIDDTSTAVVDTTLRQFFGEAEPFVPPLADSVAGAFFCYVPFHFQDTCRVLIIPESPYQALYYQVTGLQFPDTTQVEPFSLPLSPTWENKLDQWESMWDSAGQSIWSPPDTTVWQTTVSIPPSGQDTIFTLASPGVMSCLKLTLNPFSQEVLDNLTLQIFWDGSQIPSIEGSLGDIFGSHWGAVTMSSVPIGCLPPTLYSYFPSPFYKCIMTISSQHTSSVEVQFRVETVNDDPGDMRFWANTRHDFNTSYGQDYVLLDVQGKGHYMGCQLYMKGTLYGNDHLFLEGDQRIRVDGESFPSIHGTGTEDDFNGGYYFRYQPFLRAIHGAPWWQYYEKETSAYRFHLTDMVPFDSLIVVSTEHGPFNNIPTIYSSTAYFYQKSFQVDFIDPAPEAILYPEEEITVLGWAFPVNTEITVYWGNSQIGTEPTPLTTDNSGRFEAIIIAPDAAAGFYRIGAAAEGEDIRRAARTLEYRNTSLFEYNLSGLDTIAYPGVDTLFLRGEGFIPGSTVDFLLSNYQLTCLSTPVVVDSGSTFYATAIVPDTLIGLYSVTAIPSIGNPLTSEDSLLIDEQWIVEMERLIPPTVTSPGDYCGAQYMVYPHHVGEWSDGFHLELQSNAIDDYMTLGLNLPDSGYWNISMGYTLFRNGSNFVIEFPQSGISGVWLGYSYTTTHSGLQSVDSLFLPEQTTVTFRVVGQHPESRNFWIGIDYMKFTPGDPIPVDTVINDLTIAWEQGDVRLIWSPVMIDSLGHWVPASSYDIHRLTHPEDTLSLNNLLATVYDTVHVDNAIPDSLACLFYRIIGRCQGVPRSPQAVRVRRHITTKQSSTNTRQLTLPPTEKRRQ